MRGVSKRIMHAAAIAAVLATFAVRPTLAAPKTPNRGSDVPSIIRLIVRALDTIHISLPPG